MEISANKKLKSIQTIKNFQGNVYDHNVIQEKSLSLEPCTLGLTRHDTTLHDGFEYPLRRTLHVTTRYDIYL